MNKETENIIVQEVEKLKSTPPPVGLYPRWLWLRSSMYHKILKDRLQSIDEAINRYIIADMKIDTDWILERNELISAIKDYQR